jgi:hypothetical protein
LYRLFEKYPADKLCVLHSKPLQSDRVLPNVRYVEIGKVNRIVKRLSVTRFYPVAAFIEYILAKRIDASIATTVEAYKPDVIVSVTFRFRWITAYKVAKKYKLPLHLILHDDVLTAEKHGSRVSAMVVHDLKKAYRFAASRFCISPNMEAMYREKFGVQGQIIYPTFAKDDVIPALLPRMGGPKKTLRFCYAGGLYSSDFPKMLNLLAMVLKEEGHVLTLFINWRKEDLAAYDHLQMAHVDIRGFVLLNSFEEEEPFRYNFSSKIIEYVYAGLPALFWGPSSSGAINWALGHNYEGVLCEYSLEKLRILVRRFLDEQEKVAMASHLRKFGAETFSFEKNYSVLIDGINS